MSTVARLLAVVLAAIGLNATAPSSRVPAGVTSVQIRSASGVKVSVTRPREVRQIVRWFEALPPFVARPCPSLLYRPPDMRFVFRTADGGVALRAVALWPGTCSGSIMSKRKTYAEDDFVARVSRLIGVNFDPNAANRQREEAAKLDALTLLDQARVPPGSRPFSTSRVRGALYGNCTCIDVGRTWRVHMPPARVMAWLQSHRPRGARLVRTSHSEWNHFPPIRGRILRRELDFFLTVTRGGWTRVQVSAQNTWVVVRPTSEQVPAGVRTIEIRKGSRLRHRVTAPAKVATIIRWVDALRVSPVSAPICAGVLWRPGMAERISFLDGSGRVLAVARADFYGQFQGACDPMRFSARGFNFPPLLGGSFPLRVERLLR
jgi:hypothetical protein